MALAGKDAQDEDLVELRAELIVAADAEKPVILNVTIADMNGEESYVRLAATGETVSFPVSDVPLDGQSLSGWRVEYYVGGDYNAPASSGALVAADTASLSYDDLLQMISVAGIVLDHGLPTVEVYISPVFERVTENRVIEVVLDASAWTRSGARVRVYEDSADESVSFSSGYETYEGYRDDILDNDAGKGLGDDFSTFYPGCSIDGWYADGERVLSAAYPAAVSFSEVEPFAEFDESGFARLVLTPLRTLHRRLHRLFRRNGGDRLYRKAAAARRGLYADDAFEQGRYHRAACAQRRSRTGLRRLGVGRRHAVQGRFSDL